MTILEASEQLRLSRWSVYQLINQRKLVSVKVASRRLVPATEIDRFIKQLVDGTGGPA
ncbi:excisionase family DNA-binding protein [Nocardia salmonicida]|uniref:excisionase family DNA-binding protein n=1 Tax=Nocardia salmonicida TaxID=53431 RepID=UPI0033C46D7E